MNTIDTDTRRNGDAYKALVGGRHDLCLVIDTDGALELVVKLAVGEAQQNRRLAHARRAQHKHLEHVVVRAHRRLSTFLISRACLLVKTRRR